MSSKTGSLSDDITIILNFVEMVIENLGMVHRPVHIAMV